MYCRKKSNPLALIVYVCFLYDIFQKVFFISFNCVVKFQLQLVSNMTEARLQSHCCNQSKVKININALCTNDTNCEAEKRFSTKYEILGCVCCCTGCLHKGHKRKSAVFFLSTITQDIYEGMCLFLSKQEKHFKQKTSQISNTHTCKRRNLGTYTS